MSILKEIIKRRSIRKYSSKPVEKEKLDRILEAGRLAPSAKNRQQWRFIVINEPKLKMEIQNSAYGLSFISQAPVLIAVCTTNIEYKMPNGQLSYPIDITFAAANMVLQAVHEGLGTCCVSTFDEQAVMEKLTMPHAMRLVLLLTIGYGDEKPEGQIRKPIEKIVAYNHW